MNGDFEHFQLFDEFHFNRFKTVFGTTKCSNLWNGLLNCVFCAVASSVSPRT